ncbi:MAG TPA: DNA-3-methyladenine glycosylase [Egibacteraceae bacterium]|nr:DNA-3-methyladenine glycosylase [Egibacteraceae bacterium]
MTPTPLARGFFARQATEVAPDLLGKLLVRSDDGLVARIVEAEAYLQSDPACHAHRGPTERNAPLFGPPGHAYVYFTYGMHWCLNVTTGAEGQGQGCLLRACEPLEGLDVMRARRGGRPDRELLRGPARLAQAYGLDGTWSGADLCDGGPLHLADDGARPARTTTPRTGVATAADLPWRFVVNGSAWASPYKRHRLA